MRDVVHSGFQFYGAAFRVPDFAREGSALGLSACRFVLVTWHCGTIT